MPESIRHDEKEEEEYDGGFSFDLCKRNEALKRSLGMETKPLTKTGTTIAGLIFNGGVVLGADTRSTNGDVVADKDCEKIHYLAENMRCCGAGTAADTEKVTSMTSSKLTLHSYQTTRQPRVGTAVSMLKSYLFGYQGYIGAFLVLGGVDIHGPQLYNIMAQGSSDSVPFTTLGSGSLAAMSVLESEFKERMSKEEAMSLLARAVRYGVFNDNGSGSNVDLCVITREGTEYHRHYESHAQRPYRCQRGYNFPPGTTELVGRPSKLPATVADPSVFDWREFVSVEHGDTASMEVG